MSTSPSSATGDQRTDPRFRWKVHPTDQHSLLGLLRRNLIPLLWFVLLAGALGLFAWLIVLWLFAPKRTPVVILTAAPYTWPVPPNAMSGEDVRKLAAMNGETLSLRGEDEAVFTAKDFLDRLDREVVRVRSYSRSVPLIVWANLHGHAEGGPAHLIPPEASADDPDAWVTFDAVAQRLAAVDEGRNVLLILDAQRIQANWNLGLASNQFSQTIVDSFGEVAERYELSDRIAVLLTAAPEQAATVSRDLNGSVFGHYLQLGLAGAADAPDKLGDGNGWVDLSELHRYLETEVSHWVRLNRGRSQTPMLLKLDPELNFRLARSLNPARLKQLRDQEHVSRRVATNVPAASLNPLWQKLDELREAQLYRREPVAFRDLEHKLLWLEQLAVGGSDYRTLARQTLDRAEAQFKAIQARLAGVSTSTSFAAASSVVSGVPPRMPRQLNPHTLSLAGYFGTCGERDAEIISTTLASYAGAPQRVALKRTIQQLEDHSPTELAGTRWLRMLRRYQSDAMWARAGAIGKTVSLETETNHWGVPRDSAGIATDGREHRWIRRWLGETDRTRRQAEDRVFLIESPGQLFTEAIGQWEASLRQLDSGRARILLAQAACDQAMSEAPYLAQWACHPARRVEPSADKKAVDEAILPLIADTVEIARDLAAPPVDSEAFLAAADRVSQAVADKISGSLAALRNSYDDAVEPTLRASTAQQPQAVGELQALLSIPLLDWKSRDAARSALNRLTIALHEEYPARLLELSDGEGDEVEIVGSYSQRIANWERHPLDALLGWESTGENTSRRLQRFSREVSEQVARRDQSDSLSGQTEAVNEAVIRARAAASIWYGNFARDPFAEIRALDLQELLVWHTERVLDDFWGSAGQKEDFFALAARDYLASATEIARWTPTPELPLELTQSDQRTKAYVAHSRSWIETSTSEAMQFDAAEGALATVEITSTVADPFAPPEGVGTLMVTDKQRRVDLIVEPEDAVDLVVPASRLRAIVPAAIASTKKTLRSRTMFRGHEYDQDFPVRALGGVGTEVIPAEYEQSEITLNSPWEKLSVVFVLDCSASMKDMLPSDRKPRMEVAKKALEDMLFSLGLRNNVRVGVQFFGNRIGWSVDAPVQPLTRPDFDGEVDPSLPPSHDVQSVRRLEDFDIESAKEVVPQISEAKPWGQSPLYRSVVQSLAEFGSADTDADRHVIVITDGANYQFIPNDLGTLQKTSPDDVRAAWSQTSVPVHILGLGMTRAEDADAIGEFRQLCLDTGGGFRPLTSGTDLAEALRELLAPGMYRVIPAEGTWPEQTQSLGTPVPVAPVPDSPANFGVHFEGKDTGNVESEATFFASEEVLLEGGESIQLFVSRDGTLIHAYPFGAKVAAEAEMLTSDGLGTEHVVRVHSPLLEKSEVTFPISWQRADTRSPSSELRWRATKRPPSIWVEIEPIGANKSGDRYAFFETNYEADQPVPLLKLVARQWPKNCNRARVRVWAQPSQQYSGFELLPPAVSEAQPSASDMTSTFEVNPSLESPLEIAPGVTMRLDPMAPPADAAPRLRFIVEYDDPRTPVTSLKLTVGQARRAKLTRITRQFVQQQGMAVHTFHFDGEPDDLPGLVTISNREHEIEGAWQLEQTLEVDVSESGNVLPVGNR